MNIQPVRGVHDILPPQMRQNQWLLNHVRQQIQLYGYEEISIPIFEFSHVFHRLGASSDVMTKETYTFLDRGGDEITLRPEGTAGVARAVISNGLTQQLPLKFFYTGPMFRYDRPQKGRYRQFDQIGVELMGVDQPLGDVEVIMLAVDILKRLGVYDKVTLEINTIGDQASRQAYRTALVDYFSRYEVQLSSDSQRRLQHNPLRILDSKDAGDRQLIAGAPKFDSYLSDASHQYFDAVCQGLDQQQIAYLKNPLLVRGLDYYCHTAFEFTSQALGAQGTVLAGGRYDQLIEQLGGPAVAGVGWAGGIERLLLLAEMQIEKQPSIFIIPMQPSSETVALQLAQHIRQQGHAVEMTYSGNASKRLKKADRSNAEWVVMIGPQEIQDQMATLRNLKNSCQEKVAFEALPQYFRAQ